MDNNEMIVKISNIINDINVEYWDKYPQDCVQDVEETGTEEYIKELNKQAALKIINLFENGSN